jgi:hypothetical protein
MEKLTPEQLANDIIEFGRTSENRNSKDLRFGQWWCVKYRILAPDDIHALFYRESYVDCLEIIKQYYTLHD